MIATQTQSTAFPVTKETAPSLMPFELELLSRPFRVLALFTESTPVVYALTD